MSEHVDQETESDKKKPAHVSSGDHMDENEEAGDAQPKDDQIDDQEAIKAEEWHDQKPSSETSMTESQEEKAQAATGLTEEQERKIRKRELLRQARSERKRFRERQRRSDVNRGFDDLQNALMKIDPPETSVTDTAVASKPSGEGSGIADAPTNRVDLIARTVKVLEKLHRENMDMKQRLRQIDGADDRRAVGNREASQYEDLSGRDATVLVPVMIPCESMPSSYSGNQPIPFSEVPPGSLYPITDTGRAPSGINVGPYYDRPFEQLHPSPSPDSGYARGRSRQDFSPGTASAAFAPPPPAPEGSPISRGRPSSSPSFAESRGRGDSRKDHEDKARP